MLRDVLSGRPAFLCSHQLKLDVFKEAVVLDPVLVYATCVTVMIIIHVLIKYSVIFGIVMQQEIELFL